MSSLLATGTRRSTRQMGGSTSASIAWHFEDAATGFMLRMSRQVIGRLPAELQQAYAYQNALRILGPYLSPGSSPETELEGAPRPLPPF